MTEQGRERFYFSIAIIVLLLSPLTIWAGSNEQTWGFTKFEFAWSLFTPLAMILVVILIDVFISIVVYRSVRGRLWVEKPSTTSVRKSTFDGVSELAVARGRLRTLGFKVSDAVEQSMDYRKEKVQGEESFLGHEFNGTLRWEGAPGGCVLRNTVTMHDTLIVETHERAALNSLSEFIIGSSPKHELLVVPMSAMSALMHAVLLSVAVWLRYCGIGNFSGEIVGTMPVAFVFNLYAIFAIASSRDKYFGLRISIVGVLLTLVPVGAYFVAPLVRTITGW